jgi:surfeit locus 1 family protein
MRRLLFILRTSISRRWLLPTIVVLVGMGALARLGVWQLDRLEQRRALNAELRRALDSPALELTGGELFEDLDKLKDREVVVHGAYDFSGQILLKLQNWDGQTGAHLVTPLLLRGEQKAVLVDRGWIPDLEATAGDLSSFDEPGEVAVSGYIALSQTLSRSASPNQGGEHQVEWYRIDIGAIQEQLPYQLLPIYVQQAPVPGGDAEPPFRSEREIDLSEGPHLGYAVQWFIFSLMLALIYLAYLGKRTLV